VAEIDALNILRATHLAMARALAALQPPPEFALVDGLPVKGLPCPHRAIVRGDSLSLSIAAASIIAKVTRDHQLLELDRQFPGYGFAAHKGYGTALHQRALRELGPTPQHRRSFRPIRALLGIENPS
jgi:ribonuclease HII